MVPWHEKDILKEKKQLRNSGIPITESLTKLRMGKLAKAREEFDSGMCGL